MGDSVKLLHIGNKVSSLRFPEIRMKKEEEDVVKYYFYYCYVTLRHLSLPLLAPMSVLKTE
jgi:hypothetical protein